jgi:predicted RNase H-like nuclease (RuvC/YqgF family)
VHCQKQTEVQKQIESMKKKGASQLAALRESRAEIASLRGMAMDAQLELKQTSTDGPHVRKLEAEVSSLRSKLHEAQLQTQAEAEARQQVIREAGQLEESAEISTVQLQQAKVCSALHLKCCLILATGLTKRCFRI